MTELTQNARELVGTWILESFVIRGDGGGENPWGREMKGLLIYAPGGHMSVGFNRALDAGTPDRFERIYDAVLFYSGTWSVNGDEVIHDVEIATDPERVGKKVVRRFRIDRGREDGAERLILSTGVESFGQAFVTWKRAH